MDYGKLFDSELFEGVAPEDRPQVVRCLGLSVIKKPEGEDIIPQGGPVSGFGVLISGSAEVVRDDAYGNRSIVSRLAPGELFAEVFCCADIPFSPVAVVAAENCAAAIIPYERMIAVAEGACKFHRVLLANMLRIVAQKALALNRKIDHISQRSTREKLLSFLLERAAVPGEWFQIEYDRQQLADYLCVDRSAMSTELGRLRDEGIVAFRKNSFVLYRAE